ncbi:hypothetical protein GCM10018784_33840 [Streptomyces hydrogenans]|nr:hypothetical protein GCM10018784_33840 [Streptomyces hydrogenans]
MAATASPPGPAPMTYTGSWGVVVTMTAERNDVYTQWVSVEKGFRLRNGHVPRPLAEGGGTALN